MAVLHKQDYQEVIELLLLLLEILLLLFIMLVVGVIPRCYGGVFGGWIAVDSICVRNGVECNPLVTWVRIEACEVVDVGCLGCCGFHFSFCGLDIYI